MRCLGCFKETKKDYCRRCQELLFGKEQISYLLDFDKRGFLSKSIEFSSHLSISGVQDKISLKIEDKKLTPTVKDGTYILKPVPLMEYGDLIEDVAKNEHFTMQLASQVFGLETASNALIAFSDGELAYLTKRFDRVEGKKIHQEDFCSLAQQTSKTHGENYKYEYSYEEVGELIKKYLPTYKLELIHYFKLVLFNYLVGNGDAHLKNFSVKQRETGEYALTPAYDLLSSSIHLPNESRTALELFEEHETESFEANGFYAYDDFMVFADRLGLNRKISEKIVKDFVSKEKRVFELLEKSFLSKKAQKRYKSLFLNRVRAISYRFKR